MRLPISIVTSFVFIVCLFGGSPATAQYVKETTYVKRDGPAIVVRTIGQVEDRPTMVIKMIGPVEVVKVEPFIDAKKGKQTGSLTLRVVIKNTSREPRAYQVFGQGRTATGGWLGGATKAPSKGKLGPGKEATASVRTRFKGKAVPHEIRVDVF